MIQYAGGTNVNATFTGNVKNDILANVEAQLIIAGWSLVQGNVPATVTMTIASPAVVSWTAHGLIAGTRIVFSTLAPCRPASPPARCTSSLRRA
jgi:hypothetical protein